MLYLDFEVRFGMIPVISRRDDHEREAEKTSDDNAPEDNRLCNPDRPDPVLHGFSLHPLHGTPGAGPPNDLPGKVATGGETVIVTIDEKSLSELGRWPWPRTTMAGLVDKLKACGAKAVGFDVVFAEPDVRTPA